MDEFNRPLYGDVFGLYSQYQQQLQSSIDSSALTNPPVLEPWGELEPAVEEEDEDEDEEEDADQDGDQAEGGMEDHEESSSLATGLVTPMTDGFATPSGLSSVATGLATPDVIQLRKETTTTTAAAERSLYTVLPQRSHHTAGDMLGSEHVYDLGTGGKRKFGGGEKADVEDKGDVDIDVAAESSELAVDSVADSHAANTNTTKQQQDAKKRKLDERKEKKKEFKF